MPVALLPEGWPAEAARAGGEVTGSGRSAERVEKPALAKALARWAEAAGLPVEVGGDVAVDGDVAEALTLRGDLSVGVSRTRIPRRLTLERLLGHKTVANPEYVEARQDAEQLAEHVRQAADLVAEQARRVEAIRRAYVRSGGNPSLGRELQSAYETLDLYRERYENALRAYRRVQEKLASLPQLLRRPVHEEVEVQGAEVRMRAEANGRFRLEAPWLDAPRQVPVAYQVSAQDYTYGAVPAREVPADPLTLPDSDVLRQRAIEGAAAVLGRAVADALGERARRLVARAEAAWRAGRWEEAAEALLQGALLDPRAVPAELRDAVRRRFGVDPLAALGRGGGAGALPADATPAGAGASASDGRSDAAPARSRRSGTPARPHSSATP
ncbi:MAG: hypothetical protein D6729_08960 [Deltaproteobacteria bacterium]|nr:MAG: hypothetical protein D6729_08960 [Deltaproteobacteria bacterium]